MLLAEHKIDLDSECIWLEQGWFKRPDLVKAITSRLDRGDFAIATLSSALEHLDREVRNARVLAFRLPAEVNDALTAHAAQSGTPVGALLRQAVAQMLVDDHYPPVAATAPVAATPPAALPPEPLALGPARPKAVTSDVERAWFRSES